MSDKSFFFAQQYGKNGQRNAQRDKIAERLSEEKSLFREEMVQGVQQGNIKQTLPCDGKK